ncbi:metal-dependent transcriptional regulator [Carnobacteriaceae bacterium zg-ZUI252]|nr:metal-dependent transcriptional regulator [Carnobacteriaceae bacterium zg-ZUI252]QTU82644.1 metal-dependent transcriptional regulator [Carnobacteriaceae bacterium zg-C25]
MTPNKEDYLKCIYELSIQKQKVNNKRVAQVMGVSAPAVTEMFKKLLHTDLITKTTENGFQLTTAGLKVVSNLIRKHRLIEVLLLNHLKYELTQVHTEAEILEHVVSDYFVERLDAFLNYPTHCPHGSIIPKKDEILQETIIPLNVTSEKGVYEITRFYGDERLFNYMAEIGLAIGDVVVVKSIHHYAQTIVLQANEKEITLSVSIAANILVEPRLIELK